MEALARCSAEHERLSQIFPVELIYDLVDLVEVTPRISLPNWEIFPNKNHFVIFISLSMKEAEQDRTKDMIDNQFQRHFGKKLAYSGRQNSTNESRCPEYSESDSSSSDDDDHNDHDEWSRPRKRRKMTFELIPWEKHGTLSQRYFMKLWLECYPSTDMFQEGGRPPLHILAEPTNDIQAPHFVELLANNKSVAITSRTTLNKKFSVTKRVQNPLNSRFCDLHIRSSHRENLIDADQPFCRARLSWQSPVLQIRTD